eukprot:126016-Alexandrium_andersonii.AAC.1
MRRGAQTAMARVARSMTPWWTAARAEAARSHLWTVERQTHGNLGARCADSPRTGQRSRERLRSRGGHVGSLPNLCWSTWGCTCKERQTVPTAHRSPSPFGILRWRLQSAP